MRKRASCQLMLVIGSLAVLSGCRITTVPGATPPRNPVVVPPLSTPAAVLATAAAGQGEDCPGFAVAPPLVAADIVGPWRWRHATNYVDGVEDSYAAMEGMIELHADGRWTGTREIVTNMDPNNPYHTISSGPGGWTFDGYTLMFSYDDGSLPLTYDTLRRTSAALPDGSTEDYMNFEIAYGPPWENECSVHIASRVAP